MTNAFKLLDHAAIVTWGALMKSKVTNEVSKWAPPGLQLGLFAFLGTPHPRSSPAPSQSTKVAYTGGPSKSLVSS